MFAVLIVYKYIIDACTLTMWCIYTLGSLVHKHANCAINSLIF
jgi:hypothetical protein